MRCAGWTTENKPLEKFRNGAVARAASGATILRCRMCGRGNLEAAGRIDGQRFFHCCHCDFTFTVFDGITDESLMTSLCGTAGGESDDVNAGFLRPALERLKGRRALRILDFGGRDSITPDLLRQSGHRVIAFDLMPGRRQHPDRISGNILERNIPEAQFDLIYCYRVFEHLTEPAPVLRELLRLARPGGLVLIHTDIDMAEVGDDADSLRGNGNGHVKVEPRLPTDVCSVYRTHTFEVFLRNSPHKIVYQDEHTVVIERDAA